MKIGIVGGIGPESTVDYYKSIIAGYRQVKKDGSYPEIVIDSIDMTAMLDLAGAKEWETVAGMLVKALHNLRNAGAEIAVIASNTPHVVFDQVRDLSPVPVISIVEAACHRARELKLKKAGLLGTAFTMRETFYQDCFRKNGIEMVVPHADEQELIHERIFSELELGIINQKTKNEFLAIVTRMIREETIDGLVLGCTEFPLILKDGDCEIPFLNTVAIHVQSIIQEISKQS